MNKNMLNSDEKIREKLCIGVKGEGNHYYEFGTGKKINTNKAKDVLPGVYLRPDFTALPRKEICDYFGITEEQWFDLTIRQNPSYNTSLLELWKRGA